MKKCPRCSIVFYVDDRQRCLYCDTLLMNTDEDTTDLQKKVGIGFLGAETSIIKQVVEDRNIEADTRLQFIIASYFRMRTFHFMYKYARMDFLKGKVFRRQMIQKVDWTTLLVVPWFFVNLIDSILCRFIYGKFCPKCGYKFDQVDRKFPGEHDHIECEYNREYSTVIDSILSGDIIKREQEFRRLGVMKRVAKRRSAYWDLCSRKDFFSAVLDVACIWFSVSLWMLLVIRATFPPLIEFIYKLEV